MLHLLKDSYTGSLMVNGIQYDSLSQAMRALQGYNGAIKVELNHTTAEVITPVVASPVSGIIYSIKVRPYMTQPSTLDFNFHDKWNKGIPMPMRIMVGRKLQETNGLVKMELWGEIVKGAAPVCMKCGRTLTNAVSKYFQIGPECGMHDYTNPFETEEELQKAIVDMEQKLQAVQWTGWIVKSAILEEKILREE